MPTGIEYLDETWNPITGCSPISEGCKNCWAKAVTDRFGKSWGYDFTPRFHPERLNIPFRWMNPRRIGVSFMGDLFHDTIDIMHIFRIFTVMVRNPHHTFFVLTKRPKRMNSAITWIMNQWGLHTEEHQNKCFSVGYKNIWFGVSVENQETADERIPELLKINGNLWISVEPILGPVDLKLGGCNHCQRVGEHLAADHHWKQPRSLCGRTRNKNVDWVVCGAESGRGVRKVNNLAIRDLIKQCSDADVPVFLKQAWINGKLIKMPELGGRVWDQMPRGMK
ncbi:DUF5131 family protein [Candidatus Pacearchaeota archaeon]|nr:DUF5131 family protein [Candidatus Pacearchaeota archaeon]